MVPFVGSNEMDEPLDELYPAKIVSMGGFAPRVEKPTPYPSL